MFSVPDLAIVGAIALILFGPDRLPSIARQVGRVVRDVQNTSQAFIREMERAADEHDAQQEAKRTSGATGGAPASPVASPPDDQGGLDGPAHDQAARI